MKLLGIEFAPLWVPFNRRLEVLAAAYMTFVVVFGIPLSWYLTIHILLNGNLWTRTLITAYLVHIFYYPETRYKGVWGKRIWKWSRNWSGWRYFCNYFPIKLIKTVDLDPSRNYLFCSLPHGMVCSGLSGAVGTNGAGCDQLFPGLDFHVLTMEQNFKTPFYREFFLSQGGRSCDAESINYLLSTKPEDNNGRAAILVMGGAAEAFKSKPGTYHLLLKKRKGFVKIALKNGAPLVPMFSFGETDVYDQMDNPKGSTLRNIQEFVKKYTGIAPIVPIGRGFFQYTFGLLPRRRPIYVVVGAPLELPKIEAPTSEDIDKHHGRFVDSVIDLFETHKSKYIVDYEKAELVFVDD